MGHILRPIILITLILAIPIVPFLLFGEVLEAEIEERLEESVSSTWIAVAVVGALATDIFLPIPSSVVITMAGRTLGFAMATIVAWLGMTLGAIIAFVIARRFGRRLVCRFCDEEEIPRIDRLSRRLGPMVLVLTRPIPVLAEASVLFLGTTDLPWQRFVLPIGLSNLGIAVTYAKLGDAVPFPIALGGAIALPLLAATIARIAWPRRESD